MAFTPQNAEVVFRVLVTVLHLDHVARELRFASEYQILLVALPRVAWVLRPTHRLRSNLAAPSSWDRIHCGPSMARTVSLPQSCSVAVR